MMLAMRGLMAAGALAMGAFGASGTSADIYAELKGITTDEAIEISQDSDARFSELAYEEGEVFWEEYKDALIEERAELLEEKVVDGTITQAQMDLMLANMTERLENFDPEDASYGIGSCGIGRGGMMGGRGGTAGGRGYDSCVNSDALVQ